MGREKGGALSSIKFPFFMGANLAGKRLLGILDADYVEKRLELRRGECLRCGACCRTCSHLDIETHLCKTYSDRPWYCNRDFPLDRVDQMAFRVEARCGYRFTAAEAGRRLSAVGAPGGPS
jgi:hypothetical protein